MNKRLWAVGPESKQMAAIERLLRDSGETVDKSLIGWVVSILAVNGTLPAYDTFGEWLPAEVSWEDANPVGTVFQGHLDGRWLVSIESPDYDAGLAGMAAALPDWIVSVLGE